MALLKTKIFLQRRFYLKEIQFNKRFTKTIFLKFRQLLLQLCISIHGFYGFLCDFLMKNGQFPTKKSQHLQKILQLFIFTLLNLDSHFICKSMQLELLFHLTQRFVPEQTRPSDRIQ